MRINNERFTDGWAFHKLSISWKFYRRWINIPVIPPVTIFFSISREICEIRIPARCSTDIRLVWKALANSTKHHDAKFEGTHSRIAVFHETSHRAWNFSSELYYRRFTWFRLFRCDAGTRTEIESAGAAKVKKNCRPVQYRFSRWIPASVMFSRHTNATVAAELVFKLEISSHDLDIIKNFTSLFPILQRVLFFPPPWKNYQVRQEISRNIVKSPSFHNFLRNNVARRVLNRCRWNESLTKHLIFVIKLWFDRLDTVWSL